MHKSKKETHKTEPKPTKTQKQLTFTSAKLVRKVRQKTPPYISLVSPEAVRCACTTSSVHVSTSLISTMKVAWQKPHSDRWFLSPVPCHCIRTTATIVMMSVASDEKKSILKFFFDSYTFDCIIVCVYFFFDSFFCLIHFTDIVILYLMFFLYYTLTLVFFDYCSGLKFLDSTFLSLTCSFTFFRSFFDSTISFFL